MIIFLLAIAIILIVTALKGNQAELVDQLKKDFTGAGNFFLWVLAIVLIGAIGYIPKIEKISRATIGLVITVFLIANKGLLQKLADAFRQITFPTPSKIEGQANVVDPSSIGQIGGAGGQAEASGQTSLPTMLQPGKLGDWAKNLPTDLTMH